MFDPELRLGVLMLDPGLRSGIQFASIGQLFIRSSSILITEGQGSWIRRGVVVEWICHRTVDHKVSGSSPAAALMSFGKTLIYMYICHTQPS